MAAISKAEYLKRYLSGKSEEDMKKNRKKKSKVAQKFQRSVIVDDDVSWKELKPKDEAQAMKQFEFDAAGDDAPVVYDEDGVTTISTELYKKREDDIKSKWAPLRSDDKANNKKVLDYKNSQPRQRDAGRHDSPDSSPVRHSRADTPDNSPPRRRQRGSAELSPARKIVQKNQRHDSRDISPPRRKTGHDYPDLTPPRKQRHDSSDVSPPRNIRHDSPDQPSSRKRHDSSDLSPLRGRGGGGSDLDQSPPRRKRDSSDLSPPRGRRGSDSDQSPPRRRRQSPTGRKAGLLSANDLKRENALAKKRETEMFAKMNPDISGKGAQTVHRDKHGHKRDLEAETMKQKEEEMKKAKENEKFKEWGRGVAQTQRAREQIEDDLHEMEKPLARYKDDKDLDNMLKEQERDDDPMLAYMKKKKTTSNKKSGKQEKPVYKGAAPQPNRFGIQPGYRWDGVDRSNDFEKKRFAMIANKQATEKVKHKWSIEDM